MKDFISTHNWKQKDLEKVLEYSLQLKKKPIDFCLQNKSIALLFFNPSLRTRASFEVGIRQLGGTFNTFDVGKQLWNLEYREGAVMDGTKVEHIKDASKVLSRYFDAICIRSFPSMKSWSEDKKDPIISSFSKYLDIPLISMESALYHPCQALADIMTIKENFNNLKGKKFALTWCNHPRGLPTSVPNSASIIASQFGMDVTVINPKGYNLPDNTINILEKNCKSNSAEFEILHSKTGLRNADIVYAKSWAPLDYYEKSKKEKEASLALQNKKLKDWIINEEKMQLTNKAKFMHCLPVRRNVVVSDEVIDSKNSIVYDQAENRLHAQKGLMKFLFT